MQGTAAGGRGGYLKFLPVAGRSSPCGAHLLEIVQLCAQLADPLILRPQVIVELAPQCIRLLHIFARAMQKCEKNPSERVRRQQAARSCILPGWLHRRLVPFQRPEGREGSVVCDMQCHR